MEYAAEEEKYDDIDYQCVVWDGTLLAALGKVALAFVKTPSAR